MSLVSIQVSMRQNLVGFLPIWLLRALPDFTFTFALCFGQVLVGWSGGWALWREGGHHGLTPAFRGWLHLVLVCRNFLLGGFKNDPLSLP